MIRKKHAVAADRIKSFFVSSSGPLARRRKKYLRMARIRQNVKRIEPRRRETVKRSRLMVTVGSELSVMVVSDGSFFLVRDHG
jgi:hypothetical protein